MSDKKTTGKSNNSIAETVTRDDVHRNLGGIYFENVPDFLIGAIIASAIAGSFEHARPPREPGPGEPADITPVRNPTLNSIRVVCKRFKKLADAYETWEDIDVVAVCMAVDPENPENVATAMWKKWKKVLPYCRRLCAQELHPLSAVPFARVMTGLEILELPAVPDADEGLVRQCTALMRELADNRTELRPIRVSRTAVRELRLGEIPFQTCDALTSVTFGSLVTLECESIALAATIARQSKFLETLRLSNLHRTTGLRDLLREHEAIRGLGINCHVLDSEDIPSLPGLRTLALDCNEYTMHGRDRSRILVDISSQIEVLELRRAAAEWLCGGIARLPIRELYIFGPRIRSFSPGLDPATLNRTLEDLTRIERLGLHEANFDARALRNLTALRQLDIERCTIQGEAPGLARLNGFVFVPSTNYQFAVELIRGATSLRRLVLVESGAMKTKAGVEGEFGALRAMVSTSVTHARLNCGMFYGVASRIRVALPSLDSLVVQIHIGDTDDAADRAWEFFSAISPTAIETILSRDRARAAIIRVSATDQDVHATDLYRFWVRSQARYEAAHHGGITLEYQFRPR